MFINLKMAPDGVTAFQPQYGLGYLKLFQLKVH